MIAPVPVHCFSITFIQADAHDGTVSLRWRTNHFPLQYYEQTDFKPNKRTSELNDDLGQPRHQPRVTNLASQSGLSFLLCELCRLLIRLNFVMFLNSFHDKRDCIRQKIASDVHKSCVLLQASSLSNRKTDTENESCPGLHVLYRPLY